MAFGSPPDTGASSRCTVRMHSVPSDCRSSAGIPPLFVSVAMTPAGFTATTIRSSAYTMSMSAPPFILSRPVYHICHRFVNKKALTLEV